MKAKKIVISLTLLILPFLSQTQDLWQPYYITPRSGNQHVDLSANWELNYSNEQLGDLSQLPSKDWIIVKQPTSVQMAWHKAGKLPNPYEHLNATQYEWMEKKVWYYRKSFTMADIPSGSSVFLVFDGIDYFSRIWLNGKLLGYHEGMWSGPVEMVNQHLRKGTNDIVVEVKSGNYNQWDSFNWRKPGKIIKSRTFARGSSHKPFFALGMWRGVRLEILPRYHIERPFLTTVDVNENSADLHLSIELFINKHTLDYQLHPWHETQISNYSDISKAPVNEVVPAELTLQIDLTSEDNQTISNEFIVNELNGRSWLEKDFKISNPKLWYPNGLGDPHLYKVTISLMEKGQVLDQVAFDYGIRSITHIPSAGPRITDRWKDWQFLVNKKPLFVKGVNWMAIDPLYDFNPETYNWLIRTARMAGIQLLRIWGGGALETEEFYDACNRNGIMVWQDFPKNNNLTPEWPQDVWEANVVQNIIRIRNHPALVVYCGGNEFNPYAYENASTMNVLERSLDDFDPTRLWLRTSPDHGSTHLYPDFDPVWYRKKLDLLPYIAETGMHSIPEAKSLYEVVDAKEFQNLGDMYNESFATNHPEFIQHFMEYSASRVPRMLSRASHIEDMSNPTLESISEATQVGAGEFYQVMSEAIQSNYPVTTGLMPWVFKRPWPTVAAIHLLDGFGQPSAPYYFLKRTYEPLHVSLVPERLLWKPGEEFPVNTAVINSTQTHGSYQVSVKILDQKFKELFSQQKNIDVKAGPSVVKAGLENFEIPTSFKEQFFFILVSLIDYKGQEVSRSVYWPRTIIQMEASEFYQNYVSQPLEWPTLQNGPWLKPIAAESKTLLSSKLISSEKSEEGYVICQVEITNKGKNPSFMTTLDVDGGKRLFVASDNFFWMQPGETKQIEVIIKWRETPGKKNKIVVESWNASKNDLNL